MTRMTRILSAGVVAVACLTLGCDGGSGTEGDLATGRGLFGRPGPGESTSELSPAAGSTGQYTILLFVNTGPTHASDARKVKADTQKHTGWDDLMVVHEAGQSMLYWGTFASLDQASKKLDVARGARAPAGHRPFAKAIVVPLPGVDLGPARWQLKNAPGAYSVCVATFHNVPEKDFTQRKQAALAYCKQLRAQGEQAYVDHGPAVSSVCIGAFPEASVRMVKERGRIHPKIIDPRIKAILKKYPVRPVNGMEEWVTIPQLDPKTGRPMKVLSKSYAVHIPEKESAGGATSLDSAGHTQRR